MNWKLWLHSAVATTVSGAAGAGAVMIVDPLDFNLHDGLPKLLTVAAIMGVIALMNFLKQHPLPDLPAEEEESPS